METVPSPDIIPREFFEQATVDVARQLLGSLLAYEHGPGDLRIGRVVETEAYVGPDDRASHAARGRTPRSTIMFETAGFAYVYLIYGFHHCLNVVTESTGFPAAVLIRAVEPLRGLDGRTDGPGRLCRAFGIDRTLNGVDVTAPPLYFVASPTDIVFEIASGPRVGVSYAGAWAARDWRFWVRGNPFVSRPSPRTIGERSAYAPLPGDAQ